MPLSGRGLRGSALEEIINMTNEAYREEGVAVIQKIPTPIVPVEMNSDTHIITKAYFDRKSTVDYIGVMDGIALCFDAKETGKPYLPFSNIHPHQVAFMKDFVQGGGLAFLLVHFTYCGRFFLLPLETLLSFYDHPEGRHSVPLESFNERYEIGAPCPELPYLSVAYQYYLDTQTARDNKTCQNEENSL